nr:hypothetical protein [uncultured bacterium]
MSGWSATVTALSACPGLAKEVSEALTIVLLTLLMRMLSVAA